MVALNTWVRRRRRARCMPPTEDPCSTARRLGSPSRPPALPHLCAPLQAALFPLRAGHWVGLAATLLQSALLGTMMLLCQHRAATYRRWRSWLCSAALLGHAVVRGGAGHCRLRSSGRGAGAPALLAGWRQRVKPPPHCLHGAGATAEQCARVQAGVSRPSAVLGARTEHDGALLRLSSRLCQGGANARLPQLSHLPPPALLLRA